MGECIEREAAYKRLMNNKKWAHSPSDMEYAAELVLTVPAADVVEVVRCKGCKHWLKDVAGCTDFVGRCEWANYMVGANGYCVYGERKGAGADG